ncbi:DUF1223 domain-containing protein [Limnobacter parvus]|uniref:DUF1223 domain-containing protein n=1 Tax=Limnobacter parvus TaxID=2939690 RepID=A0ABT1XM56_9BURK|nr:DUF1223 domain-containing protein [Limnobacter parvus]MCR2747618.1 DUF1223 domain-containing protein [Limnobacter parvus]
MTSSLNYLKQAGLWALFGTFGAPGLAHAKTCAWTSPAERMIVAELYTSQGCSSCPPADRWLSKQLVSAERSSRILALSFHVDYWNYIGWADPYSNKQYSERQYAHKRVGNIGQVYTPQFVFSNQEVRRWSQASVIPQRLEAMKQDTSPLALHASLERKSPNSVEISVKTSWLDDRYKKGRMWLALYEDNLSQQVNAGENNGETLRHDRVVRYFSKPEMVSTDKPTHVFRYTIPADWNQENVGIGVIVDNNESNTVLQALNAPKALGLCQ